MEIKYPERVLLDTGHILSGNMHVDKQIFIINVIPDSDSSFYYIPVDWIVLLWRIKPTT